MAEGKSQCTPQEAVQRVEPGRSAAKHGRRQIAAHTTRSGSACCRRADSHRTGRPCGTGPPGARARGVPPDLPAQQGGLLRCLLQNGSCRITDTNRIQPTNRTVYGSHTSDIIPVGCQNRKPFQLVVQKPMFTRAGIKAWQKGMAEARRRLGRHGRKAWQKHVTLERHGKKVWHLQGDGWEGMRHQKCNHVYCREVTPGMRPNRQEKLGKLRQIKAN
jgi:hypothetical protein